MTLHIGVLISGSGTNLQALIDEIDAGRLDAEIDIVISSNQEAYGLKRAEAAGIPTLALTPEEYATDAAAADRRIIEALNTATVCPKQDTCGRAEGCEKIVKPVKYVIMAGYMRFVGEELLAAFPNRIVNLHPALLPSFKGAHAIQEAFDAGVKVTGVTVHFANNEYDCGPIIAQKAVPVLENDTVDTLEARIHDLEHRLYPYVVQLLAEGRISVDEETNKVHIAEASSTAG